MTESTGLLSAGRYKLTARAGNGSKHVTFRLLR